MILNDFEGNLYVSHEIGWISKREAGIAAVAGAILAVAYGGAGEEDHENSPPPQQEQPETDKK